MGALLALMAGAAAAYEAFHGPTELIYHDPERAYRGYTMFTPSRGRNTYLIDMNGEVVHTWSIPASWRDPEIRENGRLLEDGLLARSNTGGDEPTPGLYQLVDWDGTVIWEHQPGRGDRKDIPAPIRELLGEYHDPILNYAKSVTKMTALIANHEFLEKVRADGMARGYIWKEKDRPVRGQPTVPIAPAQDTAYGGLAGLYTYREIRDGLVDAVEADVPGAIIRAVQTANVTTKAGKTVLSPLTAMRNIASGLFFVTNNGLWTAFVKPHALRSVSAHFRKLGNLPAREFLAKMKALGISGDSARAREMQEIFSESNFPRWLNALFDRPGLSRLYETGKWPFAMAQRFYEFGDDAWKIVGYAAEVDRMKRGYPDKPQAWIERESAQRIRALMPTYSTVPKAIAKLTRNPLIGPFVRFPYAATRSLAIEPIRYILEDAKHPAARRMAAHRAAGYLLSAAVLWGVAEVFKREHGMSDEDEDAFRRTLPPWNRNSIFIYLGTDEDGAIRAWDSTYHNPNALVARVALAGFRDEPYVGRALEMGREAIAPFVNPEVISGALLEVARNRTMAGRPVYNTEEKAEIITRDIATHFLGAMEPGVVSLIQETYLSVQGRRRWNEQPYDPVAAAAAWVGFRVTTVHMPTVLMFRGFEFGYRKGRAFEPLMSAIRAPTTSPRGTEASIRKEFESSARIWTQAYDCMIGLTRSAQRLGADRVEIARYLRAANISDTDIAFVLSGRTRPMQFSDVRALGVLEQKTLHGRDTENIVEATTDDIKLAMQLMREFNERLQAQWELADGTR